MTTICVACGHHLYPDYSNFRTTSSLTGVTRYTLRIGRCRHAPCDLFTVPFRPEAEGRLALPVRCRARFRLHGDWRGVPIIMLGGTAGAHRCWELLAVLSRSVDCRGRNKHSRCRYNEPEGGRVWPVRRH